MAASFEGLATGAGAAGGLETLFARMRAEEALRNQGRSIDIDQFNSQAADKARMGDLAEKSREFDAEAPSRASTIAYQGAEGAHVGAETEHLSEQNQILKGLRPIIEGTGEGQVGTAGSPNGLPTPGTPPGVGGLDNPAGRLRLSLAGITPSAVFERPSEEEEYLDSGAKQRGLSGRDDPRYTFAMRNEDLAKKPASIIAQGNLGVAQSSLKLRQDAAGQRKELNDLRIKQAEASLNKIPPLQQQEALAEFRNRIQHDVTTSRTFTQWLNGEDGPDPSAQIAAIVADINTKYGSKDTAVPPGSGSPANPPATAPVTTATPPHKKYNPATGRIE